MAFVMASYINLNRDVTVLRIFFRVCFLLVFALPAHKAIAEPMTFREVSNGGVCAGCVWVAAEIELTLELIQ